MPRPPLVSALLVCACTFHPDIDPLAVRCVLGDLDGCPEGYVCGAAAGEPAGRGRCCRDGDCPLVPDGGPPDTSVVDGAPPPDAPLEGPASCDSPCAPGSKSCGPKLGLRTCVQAGGCWTWSAEESCPGHMSCNGQPPGARCECRYGDCGRMTMPGDLCAAGAILHCAVDGDGCGYVASVDFCPPELPCSGDYPQGACRCPPVPAACQGGQRGTFCAAGDLLGTCGRDVHGCLVSSQTACPAGKPCTGSFPASHCSCPGPPSAECPGAGRLCGSGGELITCAVGSDGCLAASRRSCGPGRTCTGELFGADCVCGPEAACKAPQTVGWYADLGGAASHGGNVLAGVPLDIEVAFQPVRFGVILRQPGPDLQIQYALYSSDGAGEPDRLVANTAPRVVAGSGDARIEFDVMYPLRRYPLPSGRYWMLVGLSKSTSVAHAASGALQEGRSVSFQIDWHLDLAVPDKLGGGTVTRSMGPAPNYYLVINPQ